MQELKYLIQNETLIIVDPELDICIRAPFDLVDQRVTFYPSGKIKSKVYYRRKELH